MAAAFESHAEMIKQYQDQIPYVEGANGFAVAIRDQVVSLDLFDKPATCRKVWNRLLSGFVFDSLEAADTDRTAERDDVERLLAAATSFPWEQSKAVGEGANTGGSPVRGRLSNTVSRYEDRPVSSPFQ